jgi:hypothetical protein
MDIISKGSKPVVYKSNMRLKFYSPAIEDSKVTITHIFTKILDNGDVVVFGEYTIFLLFSYLDSKNQKAYLSESQIMKFSETLSCSLPGTVNGGHFTAQGLVAQASFDPHISCARAGSSALNIEVEGEFDVFIYGDKTAPDTHLDSVRPCLQNSADSATVLRLNDTGISAKMLLDMDSLSLDKLSPDNNPPSDADTLKQ